MNDSECPYLIRETVTYRESLDLSKAAATRVIVTWRCSHPFHGIQLELGDSLAEIEERCAVCSLPRAEEAPGGMRPRRLRPDASSD